MYMRSNSPAYLCQNCKNKIRPDDLEHIFREQLRNFLFTEGEIEKSLDAERSKIKEYEMQVANHRNRIEELKSKIKNILDLFHNGQIPKEAFNEYHDPLYQEKTQREQSMLELQGMIDSLTMQTLSNDQVLHDARNLHAQWHTFTIEEKRSIIEAITESIVIGKEDIEIHLNYIPTFVPDDNIPSTQNASRTNKKKNFGAPLLFLPFKLLQLCTTGMPVRVL
jgi:site-specific DNA recombinase